MEGERAAQLVPRRPIHLVRDDAEVEADVDEHGTDRASAVMVGDLPEGGQASGAQILVLPAGRGGRFGGERFGWRLGVVVRRVLPQVVAAGGGPAEPCFERRGAKQAACDAGEDLREVAGAEDDREKGEAGEDLRVGGVLAQRLREIPAVGDERADEAEDRTDARGLGPIGIGVGGLRPGRWLRRTWGGI